MAKTSTFALKAAGPDDSGILREIFRATRAGAIAGLPEPILDMQHRAREAAYKAAFPGATDSLVLHDGDVVGRILVSRSESEHRVVDIAIVPEHQGRGLGTSLLRSLAEEAWMANKPLRLTVAGDNPALGLYRRLGFQLMSADDANVSLELRRPAGGP